jgi:hypothetical protein
LAPTAPRKKGQKRKGNGWNWLCRFVKSIQSSIANESWHSINEKFKHQGRNYPKVPGALATSAITIIGEADLQKEQVSVY